MPVLVPPQMVLFPTTRILIGVGLLLVLLLGVPFVLFNTWASSPATPTAISPTKEAVLPGPDERWRELAPMPSARSGFALAYYDRRLYIIAGESNSGVSEHVIRFDPDTNTWVSLSAKPTAVTDVHAVVLGNKIYVPGGRLQSGAISDRLEVYDTQHDRWAALKPLPQPRSGYALASVEGKLYMFGGWDGANYCTEVWQYNPDQDTWTTRTPMPTARAFAAAVTVEEQVYVMGGENAKAAVPVNERYTAADDDGVSNPWKILAPLTVPRSRMALATAGGFIFVIGGAAAADQSLLYNSNFDSWHPLEIAMSADIQDLRVQAIGPKLYIFGGHRGTELSPQAFEYQAIYNVLLPIEISN